MEEDFSGSIPRDQIQVLLGPGRRSPWKAMSSLFLTNMGQDKGDTEAGSILPPPQTPLSQVYLLGTVQAREAGASLMKSPDPWDRLLASPSFWRQTHWVPTESPPSCAWCQAHFPCNYEPGLLENL